MRKLVRLSSILLLAAVLFSCKQHLSYEEPKSQEIQEQQIEKQADNKSSDYVTVKLSVNNAAREAFIPDADGCKNYFFTLTGSLEGAKEPTEIAHWDNFDSIQGSEFQIKRGKWDLTLTANAGDYNETTKEYKVYPVLAGTCSKTITKAETISFKLEKIPDTEAPGEYYISLHYPKSEYWTISATIKDLATLNALDDKYNPTIKKESEEYTQIHGKLPAGEYKLGVKFVYKSGTLEMTSAVPVYIVIAPGCQTHGEILLDSNKLNMAHPINYVGYDAAKGNYSLPEGFPTVYSSYESFELPTPTRTDSDNYAFVGWFTDENLSYGSKIEKTPIYNENSEYELKIYPKWHTLTSPYFSIEDKEGINFVLSDSCKDLFDKGKASSMQYFVRNEETGLELNVWFGTADMIKMNYEWNYPFIDNGTSYEVWLNIGDVEATEALSITPKTGIGEDKEFYKSTDYELDENGVLHITNIPDYKDYSDTDPDFEESYVIQIWKGESWSDNPEWGDQYTWGDLTERSVDIDLIPYLEKCQLYGKPFMTNCGRDYWYKGKKYSIGFGSPTFTYGDLAHAYFYEYLVKELDKNWEVKYFDTYKIDSVIASDITDDSIKFNLLKDTNGSNSEEMIQVVLGGFELEDKKVYKISYKVKAPEEGISSVLWDDNEMTTLCGSGGKNSLEDEFEEVSYVTREAIENGPGSGTILFFPYRKGTYYIKDVSVTEAAPVTVKLMNGTELWETIETYEGTGTEYNFSSPYKNGYTFTGWYSDAALKNKVKNITKDTTTLYAGFEKKPLSENVINVSMDVDSTNGNPLYQRYFRSYKEDMKQFQTEITVSTENTNSVVSSEDNETWFVGDSSGSNSRNMRATVGLIFDMHCTETKDGTNYYDFIALAYRPYDQGFYIERYNNVSEKVLNAASNASSFKDSADYFISNTSSTVAYDHNNNYSWVRQEWEIIDKQFYEWENPIDEFTVTVTQSTPGTYTINMAGNDYTYKPEDDSSAHPEWYDKDGYRIGAMGYYANAPLGTTVYARYDTVTTPDKFTDTYGTTTYPTNIFTEGQPGSCGITLGDTMEPLTIFTEASVSLGYQTLSDGSVTWVSEANDGVAGGVAFYVKSNAEEIQITNYESIDFELVYSPITGYWNQKARDPTFGIRILPYDSTGLYNGYVDLDYVTTSKTYGTLKVRVGITEDFVNQLISEADFDSVLGFAIMFNDSGSGNEKGDRLMVQLKNVTFNRKANAPADKAFEDGLKDAQRGTVNAITYLTRDYTVDEANLTTADEYYKNAWVYLPAGYEATETTTKYPVLFLLHGFGQNEDTWGLTDQGRGGRIKEYLDRGMASGDVEKFILVCANGIADKSWDSSGYSSSTNGFNAFGDELRNDLLPWLRENYNIKDGRDNVAIAGLSLGGGQAFNIGIGECLDLISNFAAFSGALFNTADEFTAKVDGTAAFDGLKIHNLYMICGDKDDLVYNSFISYETAMAGWDRIENFESYVYPDGTHDFPVWYRGFKDFIQIVFQEGVQLYND